MKEKIKKIFDFINFWSRLSSEDKGQLLVIVTLIYLLAFPVLLWESRELLLYEKILATICYIPIGIFAGIKFDEIIENKYNEAVRREKYQKFIEECKKLNKSILKSKSEF